MSNLQTNDLTPETLEELTLPKTGVTKKAEADVNENSDVADIIESIESVGIEENEVKKISFKTKFMKSKVAKAFIGKTWPILAPFMFVMIVLVVLPLLGILIFSVVQTTNNSYKFEFSLTNFYKLFSSYPIMLSLGLTVLYAFIASVIAIVVAFPIAHILSTMKSKFAARNLWVLFTMPIWISMILKTIGLRSLFSMLSSNLLGTQVAIIIAMIYMFLPFAVAPIYNALEGVDKTLYEAALDLKASKAQAFWHVTFRQSLPGVFASFTLVFVQAATSLLIVQYMGDGRITLIPSIIESYFFKGSDFGFGATIAAVLAIILFIVMGLMNYLSRKFETKGSKKWKDSSKVVTSH